MGNFFKSSYFISFFLTTVLALMVWFLPAFIGIESLFEISPRVWIIAGLFSLCFLFWGIRFWINRRRNQAAIDGLQQINEANVVDEQSERIKDKHKKVLELLKKHKFPLSETPHYIIIGPPASGKTTILENSQLKEPISIRREMPHKEKNSDGGTRDFDWWITEEAVLIDTAGRYFGESDPNQQKSEKTEKQWKNFLEMLRKTRRKEPINGVLITFDIHDLLTQSPEKITQHISNIQQHLHELDEL